MRLAATLAAVFAVALAAIFAAAGAMAGGVPQDPGLKPEAALARMLAEARAGVPARCTAPAADLLTRVLCEGRLRVGVRDHYPRFATSVDGQPSGYEADIARAIATRLGVTIDFVRIKASTRIEAIAHDEAHLVIATMGHDERRDAAVRFVRPHYYQSETLVVGLRTVPVYRPDDIGRRAVCVTIGNRANAEFVARDVRLMLFDDPATLAERLRDGTCLLAAQDDSFFLTRFADPEFARTHDVKYAFGEVPWGMFVARDVRTERLATALGLISQMFHRDGVYLDLARRNGVPTGFLERQRATWRGIGCDRHDGQFSPACVLPPRAVSIEATPFAAQVTAFETWVARRAGVALELPMLKTAPEWRMFMNGIAGSLWLVAGTLAATLLFSLLIGQALASRHAPVRRSMRSVVVICQSMPVVLAVVIGAAVANAMFELSPGVAIVTAVFTLGLTNGAHAGQAIAEALQTLRTEAEEGARIAFGQAVARASTQLTAFLVNATKGTPVASFIGAPELLSELTDISSIASGRAMAYFIVLVFYTIVVFAVVGICGRLRAALGRRHPG